MTATSATSPWRRTWVELKAAAVPVAAFWAMTALGFSLLVALYILDEGDPEGILIFGALAATTFVGIGMGQLAALLRLRTWIVAVLASIIWGGGVLFAATQPPLPEEVLIVIGLMVVLLPFFLLAGLWSLRVHMGLLATWAPLVYVTASIIVIAEQFTGSSAAWFEGNKWAIWDLFSLPVLLLGTGFLVIYLAARERHRIQLWRFAKGGPELPRAKLAERKGGGLGCGQVFAVIALTLVLAGGAAVLAPYLWRSAPADDGDGTGGPGTTVEQPAEPPPQQSNGCTDSSAGEEPEDGGGSGEPMTQEEVVEAVRQAGISFATLILVVLLGLLGLLIFIPPMRRSLLLRHLRKPLWPVPPTRQVLQAWRVVEIALADIGIRRRPGDSAEALARRAMDVLPPDVDHTDLLRCARVTDRVLFGLGVDPGDPEHARRTAEMTYQVVWEIMGEGQRLVAVYRFV